MAIPFLLPLLFAGGSALANKIGSDKAASAVNAANQAERIRQKRFDDEQAALTAQSLGRYDDVQGQQDKAAADLTGMFTQAMDDAPATPIAALPQSSSNLVVQNETNARNTARSEATDRARRLGEFRGFGDALGGIQRMQGRDNSQLELIGSMRRGSQGVLPMELDAASQKGRGWMMLGDLLNLGSSVLTGPALLGKGLGGGLNIGGTASLFGGNSWGA